MGFVDEVVRLVSEVAVRHAGDLIPLIRSRGPQGTVAQPLNAYKVACPKCGARESWENAP